MSKQAAMAAVATLVVWAAASSPARAVPAEQFIAGQTNGNLIVYVMVKGELHDNGTFTPSVRMDNWYHKDDPFARAAASLGGATCIDPKLWNAALAERFQQGVSATFPGTIGTRIAVTPKPAAPAADNAADDALALLDDAANDTRRAIDAQSAASRRDTSRMATQAGEALAIQQHYNRQTADAAQQAVNQAMVQTAVSGAQVAAAAATAARGPGRSGSEFNHRIRTTWRYQGQVVKVEEATYRASDVEHHLAESRRLNPAYQVTAETVWREAAPQQGTGPAPAAALANATAAMAAAPGGARNSALTANQAQGAQARDSSLNKLKDALAGPAAIGREVLDNVNQNNGETLKQGDIQLEDIKDNTVQAVKDMVTGKAQERAEREARDLRARQKFGRNYDQLNVEQKHEIDFEEMSLRAADDGWTVFSLKQKANEMKARLGTITDNIKAWMNEQHFIGIEGAATELMKPQAEPRRDE